MGKHMSRRMVETSAPTAAAVRLERVVRELVHRYTGTALPESVPLAAIFDEETGLPGLIADCKAALEWLDEHDGDPEIQTPAQRTLRAAIAQARR